MRTQLWAFVLVAALGGCSSSSSTRTVTGELRAAPASATVTAQTIDHVQYQSAVASTGRFTLELPTNVSYELSLGSARIDWPTATGPARWARLGNGPALDLGHVSRDSDGHYSCDHHGSSGDNCDRDDGDGGDDDDHGDDDGDGGYGDHGGGGYGGGGGGHSCDGGSHHGGADGGTVGQGGGSGTGGGGVP